MRYLVLVLFCFFGLLLFAYGDRAVDWVSGYLNPKIEEPVPTLRLQRRDYTMTVTAEGELTGLQTVPVSVPPLRTGAVKIGWIVEEGTFVTSGDLVVRLESTEAALALEQNKNTFDSYLYQIEKAGHDGRSQLKVFDLDRQATDIELTYAENQIRIDEEIFSRWEIQESVISAALARYKAGNIESKRNLNQGLSQAQLRILNIERQKAQSEMNLAQQTLSSLDVKAPAEGIVLYKRWFMGTLPKAGDEVWGGQAVAELANLRRFQGKLNVIENDIAGVEKAKSVEVALYAFPGQTFSGTIKRVATVAQQLSRQDPRKFFTCEVLLDVPVEIMTELKPGMQLAGKIRIGERKRVLVVPKSAVIKQETEFIVFVRQAEKYVERKIKILESDYGFHVVEGLREGDEVCLQHPYEKQKLHLPDFSAPSAPTQGRRFFIGG